jgi:2-methylcitrate dehydratase PrpD
MPTTLLDIWSVARQRASGDASGGSFALTQARRSWFDTAATVAGGSRERCTAAALVAARGSGRDDALVLGTASHALDFDDVCMLATCHPSAPVVTALLAVLPAATRRRPELRLDQVLSAYLIGTEVILRLGERLGFRHYGLGFHATATLGVVGAAAACAQVMGLRPDEARAALAIAASSASGLRANFGTDVKPLHVGFAASAGLRAVLLAEAGAIGSDDVWGDKGFDLAFNGGGPVDDTRWTPETPWAIESPGFEHKRFPSCYLSHRLIAGVLVARERLPAAAREGAVAIDVEVPKTGLSALKYPSPSTGLEGKFSGPYCAATAWLDGHVRLASFTDEAVRRPAIAQLMTATTVRERTGADERLDTSPVTVRVRAGGHDESVVVDWAPGSPADPMTTADLAAKWSDCAQHAGVDAPLSVAVTLLDAPGASLASDVLGPLRKALLAVTGADQVIA